MKTILSVFIVFFLMINLNAQEPHFLKNTIIVKLHTDSHQKSSKSASLNTIKQTIGSDIKEITPMFNNYNSKKQAIPEQYNLNNIYKITLNKNDNYNTILHNIKQLNEVKYAEPYPISIVFDEPNDPAIPNQYYLDKIEAFNAHEYTKGDTNITIGIVDSGVDLLHEDLKDNYKYNYNDPINNIDDDMDGYIDNYYGWDVADNNNNPQGQTSHHGTRVSGMASAVTNNNIGIYSIGYKTKILPIKAMDISGKIVAGYEGIVYAADHGCQIINCSWGSNYPSQFAQDVINYAAEYRNCLIVAAAGNKNAAINDRPDIWWYPASYDNVLSVAATGSEDIHWKGTSFATSVDVCAPGENVYTTDHNNSYKRGFGTSYAAPLVAGLAGLLKAQKPELTQQQLAAQIRITSDNIDTIPDNVFYSKQLGYGRINALRALTINNLPSIQITDLNITTNRNSTIFTGDTLLVTFTSTNILSQVSNTSIRLITNSEYIVPIDNFFSTGELKTFESIDNISSPLAFKINPGMPYNENVWFTFEMKAEGYDDYQIFEVVLNRNYIDFNENDIKTSLTSNGKLGHTGVDNNLGSGLTYKKSNSLIINGGIIIGLSSNQMASALFEIEEFSTIEVIDTTRNNKNILFGNTIFSPLSENNIPISITQSTTADTSNLMESTVVYIYNLQNKGIDEIENIKMAQFVDWDLYSSGHNSSEYNENLNLFYTYSTDNSVLYAGICLVNKTSSTPYGFDLISGGNGGVDITNGFSNDLKWLTMTNNRPQAGDETQNIDVANMLTTDYFNIPPNDTVKIIFAHIIGDNYNDLINKTIAVREAYYEPTDPIDTVSINNNINVSIKVFPNPTNNNINIINTDFQSEITIEIYNLIGKLQLIKTFYNTKNILIDVKELKTGIYTLNYQSDIGIFKSKFIKID